jgi:hypothetical protein
LTTIARLISDAKVKANSFNTQQLAWDESALIEDSHLLDDTTIFDDTAELDTLITYLFDSNIPSLEDYTGNIILDEHGNIFSSGFYNTQPSFDDSAQIDDTLSLDDTHQFDSNLGAEEVINYLFGINSTETSITKISIHNNKKITANQFVVGVDS